MQIVEHFSDSNRYYYNKDRSINGFKVTVDALAEVGRLDLVDALVGGGPSSPHYYGFTVAHFYYGSKVTSIYDLALIEKAMRLGYAKLKIPYECGPCEEQFALHGVSHGPDLIHARC